MHRRLGVQFRETYKVDHYFFWKCFQDFDLYTSIYGISVSQNVEQTSKTAPPQQKRQKYKNKKKNIKVNK